MDSAFGLRSIIETHYGNIVMDDSGNVRVDNGVWERSFAVVQELDCFQGKCC